MKQMILRNFVLVPTALVMVLLTLFGTMTTHVEATLQKPTPKISPTQAATQLATAEAANKVPRIAFVANRNGSSNIYTMDPDGKNIVQLTNTRDSKEFPVWSPDGKHIAYLSPTTVGVPPRLMVMDANGLHLRKMTLGKAIAISPPGWSPDSNQIAYISVRSKASDSGIYIVDVTTNHEHKLQTSTPINFAYSPPPDSVALTDAFQPAWSPDGKHILVYGGLGTRDKELLLVSTNGKTVTPFLKNSTLVAMDASWSPDGKRVLFVGGQVQGQFTKITFDIVDASGISVTELPSSDKLITWFPVWSADGTQIVFTGLSFTTQLARIYVMNADGSNLRQLTEDTFSRGDGWPSWGMVPADLVKR
jgi:Tol biopolymer transport system component